MHFYNILTVGQFLRKVARPQNLLRPRCHVICVLCVCVRACMCVRACVCVLCVRVYVHELKRLLEDAMPDLDADSDRMLFNSY